MFYYFRFISYLFLCISGVATLHAQAPHFFEDRFRNEKRSFFILHEHSFTASNVPSEFVFSYINGDYIAEDKKNRALAILKPENSGLYLFSLEAGMRSRISSSGLYLIGSASYHSFAEFNFSKDLFEIYFKGNKGFEGKTAQLDPFWINNIQYGKAKIGLEKSWSKGFVALHAGLISGNSFFQYRLNSGSIYTEEFGKRIELDLKLRGYDLDNNKTYLFSGNSLGYTLGGEFKYKLLSKISIRGEIQNVGELVWKEGIRERTVDTIYDYAGFEISNILDSFAINLKSTQEIKNDFIKERIAQSRGYKLPYFWSFSLNYEIFHEKLEIEGLYKQMVTEEVYPLYLLSLKYFVTENLGIAAHFSKRFNGREGFGISAAWMLFNRLSVELDLGSVESVAQQDKPLQLHSNLNLYLKI